MKLNLEDYAEKIKLYEEFEKPDIFQKEERTEYF